MKAGDIVNLIVAVDWKGHAHGIAGPDDVIEHQGDWCEGGTLGDELAGMPDEPGVYRVVAEFWHENAYCDGNRDPSGDEWGFRVVKSERIYSPEGSPIAP